MREGKWLMLMRILMPIKHLISSSNMPNHDREALDVVMDRLVLKNKKQTPNT
jgi:hypothetical protein